MTTKISKIVFDIECDSLKPSKIHCIVAKEINGEVYKFPPHKLEEGVKFLQSAETLIGHNILSYDIPVIKKIMGVDLMHKKIEDTLVMSRLFNPIRENGHSLKTWGYRVNFVKQEQPLDFDEYTPKMLEYCVNDVRLNEIVYHTLVKEGKDLVKSLLILNMTLLKLCQSKKLMDLSLTNKKPPCYLLNLKLR